ncbi:phosphate transporter subunit; periplasmic-binding component of ABC superfamily [Hyella patelloides LEGE 07179]|uniref:Phosphate-binding protein n=1 Tax=Hyella patelloides LEGE 07179 TaxID=945734 RepID=A0A563VLQ7_9CYAN|nr:phosphate ABC transporter substrate-binding protein PstS [Hyella patelloides]VEP12380.1 phosphate transporter subunit; periplasmic-binding component of ABC superfamily [Hyella patelloides LEGE 07179]
MISFTSTKRKLLLAPVLALSLSLASCGGSETATSDGGDAGGNAGGGQSVSLTGAGASFPAPLYQRWFAEYNKQNPNVQVTYQSVGSGAGVEQFTQKTVDFGASDVAMKDEEMAAVDQGVVLLPMTAGSIVLAYNLPDIEGLQLSRQVYTDILLGKITKWNDPAIASINPDVQLPDTDITVVHRSDGSGTTGVFTQHLAAISPEWEQKVGSGKTVEWPTGLGAKGNEGVTAQILQTEGSIGYIEYGYAKQQEIPTASLENQAGNYIAPSSESASQALSAATLPENLRAFVTDPEGEDSYPIVTYTWILAYENYDDPEKLNAFKEVINWSLTEGQAYAEELGYIPLPENVVTQVENALGTIQAQ